MPLPRDGGRGSGMAAVQLRQTSRTPLRRRLLAAALVAVLGPPAFASGSALRAAAPRRAATSLRSGPEEVGAAAGRGLPDAAPGAGRRPAALAAALAAVAALGCADSARALVKGVAPPKNYGIGKNFSEDAKCKNKQECQDEGSKLENQKFGGKDTISYLKTPSGARYKDIKVGEGDAAAKDKEVALRYRVMRSGKRSSDGLSGEASTIFSWGFGEADGEPKDASLKVALGSGKLVKAMDEGVVGMAVGGMRRIQVRPENGLGWKKEGKCATEVQAIGLVSGLPVGGAEVEEACLDDSKVPLPKDFAEQRRFSRRFDESLIVEVELVSVK